MKTILITSGNNGISSEVVNFPNIVGVVESVSSSSSFRIINSCRHFVSNLRSKFLLKKSLKVMAENRGMSYFKLTQKNPEEFYNWIKEISPDLLIVYSMSQLIESRVINLCKFGGINLHPSLLPDLKGPNPFQWAFLRNDSVLGYTLHFIDAAEDSGEIISQSIFEIPRGSQISSLESKMVVKHGLPLIRRAYYELIKNGFLLSRAQPVLTQVCRARRLTLSEFYDEIKWGDWDIERIWHCISGIPEVTKLIPVESYLIRRKTWNIGDFSANLITKSLNSRDFPYIKYSTGGYAIFTPKGTIEVQFKTNFIQIFHEFVAIVRKYMGRSLQ